MASIEQAVPTAPILSKSWKVLRQHKSFYTGGKVQVSADEAFAACWNAGRTQVVGVWHAVSMGLPGSGQRPRLCSIRRVVGHPCVVLSDISACFTEDISLVSLRSGEVLRHIPRYDSATYRSCCHCHHALHALLRPFPRLNHTLC